MVDNHLELLGAIARNFIPVPFDPGATMYCTGDIRAWNDDMEVFFFD